MTPPLVDDPFPNDVYDQTRAGLLRHAKGLSE